MQAAKALHRARFAPAARCLFRKCEKVLALLTDGFSLPIAVPPKRNRKSPVFPRTGLFLAFALSALKSIVQCNMSPARNLATSLRGDPHV